MDTRLIQTSGRVSIPDELLMKYDLGHQDKVLVIEGEGCIELVPEDRIEKMVDDG